MVDFTGQGGINNRHSSLTNELIRTLIARLASHPLINDPCIFDSSGEPVRITKFRNYDGIELINVGKSLTLSIFPYSFIKDDHGILTSASTNASIVYKPFTLGNLDTPQSPLDTAFSHIVLKLHLFGYERSSTLEPLTINNQITTFEYNESESILQEWAEVLRIILTSDLRLLPAVPYPCKPLLRNSFVNWINFGTGRWDAGENLIFHTSTLLWQGIHYPNRLIANDSLIEVVGGYVGNIPDPAGGAGQVPVCYDLGTGQYTNCATQAPIPPSALIDPVTNTTYASLNVNVVQIYDMLDPGRRSSITINT